MPIVFLVTVCAALGLESLADPPQTTPRQGASLGVFDATAWLTVRLFQDTGSAMLSVMLVVLGLVLMAYWLRQKIRLLYGFLELVIGVLMAGVALAQFAADAVPTRPADIGNADLFRVATGIYFVIRGMSNIRDGIEIRKKT